MQTSENNPFLSQGDHGQIIDAQIVEEVHADKAASAQASAQKGLSLADFGQGAISFCLAAVLWVAYLQSESVSATQVTYHSAADFRLSPQAEMILPEKKTTDMAGISFEEDMQRMRKTMDRMQGMLKQRERLNTAQYEVMKTRIQRHVGAPVSDGDLQAVLAEAGYKLPAEHAAAPTPPKPATTGEPMSRLELIRYVANELIKEEVSGFVKKVELASMAADKLAEE